MIFNGKEYVYEIYRERSFSTAAQKLYTTQPALSNKIKRIEDEIGSPIFDRSTSPIQLTEVGKAYVEAVEQMIRLEENFANFLADTQNLKKGSLSIGSGAMFSSYVLPPLLAEYKAAFPCVEVSVQEGGVNSLQRRLLEGAMDLLIENEELPLVNFERQRYRTEYMILAVPRSWELNGRLLAWQQSLDNIVTGRFLAPQYPNVPLDQFAKLPFVLLSPENRTYQKALAACGHYGFVPRAILTLNQQLTAYNMTCAGVGASFVSDTLVRSARPHPDVVYYKLDMEFARRDIFFYFKKKRYIPKCMGEFLRLVEEKSRAARGAGERDGEDYDNGLQKRLAR